MYFLWAATSLQVHSGVKYEREESNIWKKLPDWSPALKTLKQSLLSACSVWILSWARGDKADFVVWKGFTPKCLDLDWCWVAGRANSYLRAILGIIPERKSVWKQISFKFSMCWCALLTCRKSLNAWTGESFSSEGWRLPDYCCVRVLGFTPCAQLRVAVSPMPKALICVFVLLAWLWPATVTYVNIRPFSWSFRTLPLPLPKPELYEQSLAKRQSQQDQQRNDELHTQAVKLPKILAELFSSYLALCPGIQSCKK